MIPALRDALTTHLLLLGFPAHASYTTKIDVKSLDQPRLTVIPSSKDSTPVDRAGRQKIDAAIDLAYRAKVTDTANLVECDQHDAKAEAIVSALTVGTDIGDGWKITAVTRPTLFSVEHLQDMGVFTSIVRVTLSKVA